MALELSLVIPVRDERESVAPLAGEIARALEAEGAWECLWVDDGSLDGTPEALEELHRRDGRHQYLLLSRGFGQSIALAEGFRRARGRLIATMDGDGQNDPADLPRLIAELRRSGAGLVNGRRERRQDDLLRRVSSRVANAFRNWMLGERVSDVGCSLRVFRRECVEGLPVFRGLHRFLPTLARLNGCGRILELPVHHRPRRYGATKYGVRNRLWVGLWDAWAVRWMLARMSLGAPPLKGSSFPAPAPPRRSMVP